MEGSVGIRQVRRIVEGSEGIPGRGASRYAGITVGNLLLGGASVFVFTMTCSAELPITEKPPRKPAPAPLSAQEGQIQARLHSLRGTSVSSEIRPDVQLLVPSSKEFLMPFFFFF